ncbi:MAG TPA: Rieske (2Fe-2S) protein [Gaiellaceae bacterium]|nr:Rieske (2Fe-2S) protein [Gaiellaceae bacterium]
MPLAELEDGRAVVEVGGHEILLLRVEGSVHALANACPHRGNPLVDGEIVGDQLRCAYHGWRFDLGTGACLVGDEAARRYEIEVAGDDVRILLDPSGSGTTDCA